MRFRTPLNCLSRLLLLTLLGASGVVGARQNQLLTIREDGSIAEVPSRFGHVFLKISQLGSTEPVIEFGAAGRINTLPACITRHIRSEQLSDVVLSGSWYDEQSAPSYVAVQFYDSGLGKDKSHTTITFTLQTAEINGVNRFVVNRKGSGGNRSSIRLPDGCVIQGLHGGGLTATGALANW